MGQGVQIQRFLVLVQTAIDFAASRAGLILEHLFDRWLVRCDAQTMARRRVRIRIDLEILARTEDIELLRAVQDGLVVRGLAGGETAIMAVHCLAGDPIRLQLCRLACDELISMPISGPPALDVRGRRLLEIANGEVAFPLPD